MTNSWTLNSCVTYNLRHPLLYARSGYLVQNTAGMSLPFHLACLFYTRQGNFQGCSSRGKFDCHLNQGKLSAGGFPSLMGNGSLLYTILAFFYVTAITPAAYLLYLF